MNQAREEILNKLKSAVHSIPEKPDFDEPIYHTLDSDLELVFKENLEKVNGFVYLYQTENELYESLKEVLTPYKKEAVFCNEENISQQLTAYKIPFLQTAELYDEVEVGITGCEFLIAHTGSVMVSSAQKGGRQMFVFPTVHIVVARKNQLVDYLEKAYYGIRDKYKNNFPSQVTLITGPSRTADIEKTLVLGAHGPRELKIFLY